MVPSQDGVGSCFSVSVITLLSCFASKPLPFNSCSGHCWYYLYGLDLEGCLGPPPPQPQREAFNGLKLEALQPDSQ